MTPLAGGVAIRPGSCSARSLLAASAPGLYGILMFAMITVFIGGLMVGRTPSFSARRSGARGQARVDRHALMPIGFLIWVGISSVVHAGGSRRLNAGPHGFSEILYGFASTWNNNGSALPGITVATPSTTR